MFMKKFLVPILLFLFAACEPPPRSGSAVVASLSSADKFITSNEVLPDEEYVMVTTAINLPLCALLVLGADRVIALLRTRPRVMRAIDYTFAGIFGAFAVKILAMPGR